VKKRGRPAQEIDSALQAWLAQPAPHNKSSSEQVVWRAGCGSPHHKLVKTVSAVHRQYIAFKEKHTTSEGFAPPCPHCGVGTASSSGHQRAATDVITALWPCSDVFFDVCLPGGESKSSADVTVGRLMVMVDGEGHFGGMHTMGADESQYADRHFELQAFEAGYNVVRLHGNDGRRVWRATLRRAKALTEAGVSFIMFSPLFTALGLSDAIGVPVRARWLALIEQARLAMGERDSRPGRNRERRGYHKH
jgi:hypothetical protein